MEKGRKMVEKLSKKEKGSYDYYEKKKEVFNRKPLFFCAFTIAAKVFLICK